MDGYGLFRTPIDLNIFDCFNIYMYKQKGRATSSSNISYGPSQVQNTRPYVWMQKVNKNLLL